MDVMEYLKNELIKDKKFSSVEKTKIPELQVIQQRNLDFIGSRKCWGSFFTILLIKGDRLGKDDIADFCNVVFSQVKESRKYANSMPLFMLHFPFVWPSFLRLGSFGLICFVLNKYDKELIEFIREQKNIDLQSRVITVSWILDIENVVVHTHKSFPLTIFPGRKYLENIIRKYKLIINTASRLNLEPLNIDGEDKKKLNVESSQDRSKQEKKQSKKEIFSLITDIIFAPIVLLLFFVCNVLVLLVWCHINPLTFDSALSCHCERPKGAWQSRFLGRDCFVVNTPRNDSPNVKIC